MRSKALSRVLSWLNKLKSEIGANSLLLLDKRGFVIGDFVEGGNKRMYLLMKAVGNYTILADSYFSEIVMQDLNYSILESKDHIFISYRLKVDEDPYYLVIAYKNRELPIGIVLMRLETVGKEFGKVYEEWNASTSSNEPSESVDDLENIINKLEGHPLFKTLIKNIKEPRD